jgi:rubredoxin
LGRKIIMSKTDIPVQWQNGSGESVEIGYLNRNGQQCCGHCGVSGTDYMQYAYKTECTICGYVYGTNASDMDERRCPEFQGGAPGIKYWKISSG